MENLEHKLKEGNLYKQSSKPDIGYLGNNMYFDKINGDFYMLLSYKRKDNYSSK